MAWVWLHTEKLLLFNNIHKHLSSCINICYPWLVKVRSDGLMVRSDGFWFIPHRSFLTLMLDLALSSTALILALRKPRCWLPEKGFQGWLFLTSWSFLLISRGLEVGHLITWKKQYCEPAELILKILCNYSPYSSIYHSFKKIKKYQ